MLTRADLQRLRELHDQRGTGFAVRTTHPSGMFEFEAAVYGHWPDLLALADLGLAVTALRERIAEALSCCRYDTNCHPDICEAATEHDALRELLALIDTGAENT